MITIKNIVEFSKKAFESLENMGTIFGALAFIGYVAVPYVSDEMASPFDYDYVFVVKNIPDPLRAEREKLRSIMTDSYSKAISSPDHY